MKNKQTREKGYFKLSTDCEIFTKRTFQQMPKTCHIFLTGMPKISGGKKKKYEKNLPASL